MTLRLMGGVLAGLWVAVTGFAGPRDAQWKQVEDAAAKQLPKTAIAALEPIIQGAMADKAYPEAIKAIAEKIALEGQIQGGRAEEKIVRFQTELAKAPAPMHPVMEAVLAHWYWDYFQQHRWQFLQRTQTASSPGPDLQTWDLARILAEIDQHFTAALANAAVLQATPISDYSELLQKGTVPDAYRPTLFDFLAYDALPFYQTGEQASVGEDEFEIEAAGPMFGSATDFEQWQPKTADPSSLKLRAIRLYQALLNFHRGDADPSAYYDADLARLTYGHNVAVGDDKDDRYKAALQRFIAVTSKHEISARALAALAGQSNAEGDPAKAHEVAERGRAAFPRSAGGILCANLIHQIEAPSAQLLTEHVWNPPWPTLDITYRNITRVYFRAYARGFDEYVRQTRWNFNGLDSQRLDDLLKLPPPVAWNADLPATSDYKDRTEKLPAPTSLKPGFYVIVASADPSFRTADNQISATTVWVSNLALVLRTRNDSEPNSGLVLNAITGEAVAGAMVRFWQREREVWQESPLRIQTDLNGEFEFSTDQKPTVVLAQFGNQAVASASELYSFNGRRNESASDQAVFFTDRAIYRPGQTIHYNGIVIHGDPQAGTYGSRAGLNVTVVFSDPNQKEIARAELRTNDYGSFSGIFTAPRDRLMGGMILRTLYQPGMTTVRVEEYKRPKFRVEIKPPAEAAKLGEKVEVTGSATAYTGAAIGGAKVKWRVERAVQLPYWCWWFRPLVPKAIAHGTAVTEPDGTFKLEFTADPDRAVPAKNEPTFVFTVHADVTDTTGETRSEDRRTRAGYTALQASVTADDWQTNDNPVDITIATKSLDGDAQPAEGTVTVYALKQPAAVARGALQPQRFWWPIVTGEPKPDPTNPDSWELGASVAEKPFKTDTTGGTHVTALLPAGIYRVSLETKDRFGKKVTARRTVQVIEPKAARYGVKLPNLVAAPKWSVEPGETFNAVWGTGYDSGRALVEVLCNGKLLQRYWTGSNRTQQIIAQPVTEDMRGGFTVRVTYVRENRAYFSDRVVDVSWTNKRLAVKWERFRSKLEPGQKETWTAVVSGPDAKRAAAEMVATLYDASLDQYLPHRWPEAFNVFRREFSPLRSEFQNTPNFFQGAHSWYPPSRKDPNWRYRTYPRGLMFPRFAGGDDDVIMLSAFEVSSVLGGQRARGYSYYAASASGGAIVDGTGAMAFDGTLSSPGVALAAKAVRQQDVPATVAASGEDSPVDESKPDLSQITARRNLDETAFFFPHLLAGDDGVVKMEFTVPEALTEWKFLGFAHDKELRAGFLTDSAVTAKDLMVEPNPPRFVREGDVIEFTVKVSNRTDTAQSGRVRLNFADAASLESADPALGNRAPEQSFEIPAKQSRTYSWRIAVPDGMGFLTYKAVAASVKASDGEEGPLPVLSRRILVTESLPLPIRGKSTKDFEFKKLLESSSSSTLRNESLTIQMVSHPAWYAVMALPYLMQYPYECSEQVFNRYYADALAQHIANSNPKIRRIFNRWRDTPALQSPLEKNQDLKSVMLEETPWVRDAQDESQARRNVGLLFDPNQINEQQSRALQTLADRQLSNGLWSWFPGGRPSEYISLYIMTGFGRLRHLGVDIDVAPAIKALNALDAWMDENYQRIRRDTDPDQYVPGYLDAQYLYGRSFYLKDQPVQVPHREAIDFYLGQARKYWTKVNSRQCQAQLALALQRFGDTETPGAIVRSLKERSVTSEELGMFWRDTELSWWWYAAPIETQAMMIEAFADIAQDAQAVEDCKVWLLKQKQTQDWRTTKATADAVYALLLRGDSLLTSDELVDVSLGGEAIKPDKVEAGTGFYEQRFVRGEIKPAMGRITVTKHDDGVSWGAVHWQYLEDVAKVTPHTGTPLQLKKTLFIKETTAHGQVLKPVTGPLSIGDELVVRIELRTDRDMEFVHLKDQRGSGTEPVDVLSKYRYQDGLWYYESTRDTATHFFIDYLPKGTYVFEYSTRVQLKGKYQTGIAEIQCMYAPEFNSHSESVPIEAK